MHNTAVNQEVSPPVGILTEQRYDAIANDPVLSPAIATSHSRSRIRVPTIIVSAENQETTGEPVETDPLLGREGRKSERKKPFYRPRPLW